MSFVVPADWKSWAPAPEGSHFPIQNLPFGKFVDPETGLDELGVRIGEQVLALRPLADSGMLEFDADLAFDLGSLSEALGGTLSELRKTLAELLREDCPDLRDHQKLREEALLPCKGLEMVLPAFVHGFVDFYSGIHHATNVGKMFRPDQPPLLPNYRHLPVAYSGRASSVIVSGEAIKRPKGQFKLPGEEAPDYRPTRELDFELEMGFFVGKSSNLGEPVPIEDAEKHVLGLALVNDWSARDIQRWEYQPLGPFLAKSFGTSVSPWVVTLDALEPFRIEGAKQDPEPLPHLRSPGPSHFDIHLEIALQTKSMSRPQTISRSNTRHLYWSLAQQVAHMTSNGANLEPGDLCASGTISGPEPGSLGSMLEIAWKGEKPVVLEETGESRSFLEDGDTVIFTGWAERGALKVGFGELRASVFSSE